MTEEFASNPLSIYSVLGKYIKDTFFGDDKKGDEVFPIIDTYFIKKFCEDNKIKLNDFSSLIQHRSIWNITHRSPQIEIIGFIGIQLYAASKMENADGYASSNFRDRICSREILNIDVTDWQQWVTEYQDILWEKYYSWCSSKGFYIVNRCHPGYGKDRYVQYPKRHSELILNREDLKRIAYFFVEKKLKPNENISERDFWSIIGIYHLNWYYSTRAKRILEADRQMANKQIYQFFLLWDGEYVDDYKTRNAKVAAYQLYLYNLGQEWSFDIIDYETRERKLNISLSSTSCIRSLKSYYDSKWENAIIFKKCEEYDNYWDETRYIESHNEEGIALFNTNTYRAQKYYDKDVIKRFSGFVLVKINFLDYSQFYAAERPYSLQGGLKIAPNTYILGATPLLELKSKIQFWVDGQIHESEPTLYSFNLQEGSHQIKIKGYKSIEIRIVKAMPVIHKWIDYYKWKIEKSKFPIWKPIGEDGVVGLDFEPYSLQPENVKPLNNPLTQWRKTLVFRYSKMTESTNVVISLLNK